MSTILYASGMPKQDLSNQKKTSCGCKAQQPSEQSLPTFGATYNRFDKLPSEEEILRMATPTASTKAAMCHVCPFRAKGANGGATGCTINGKSIGAVANFVNPCPMDRWTIGSNQTQWMGLTWAGVPEPIRWLLTWDKKRNVNLDGCGCVVGLKESRIGPYIEPFLEGISMARERFGNFLAEFNMVMGSMKEPVAVASK